MSIRLPGDPLCQTDRGAIRRALILAIQTTEASVDAYRQSGMTVEADRELIRIAAFQRVLRRRYGGGYLDPAIKAAAARVTMLEAATEGDKSFEAPGSKGAGLSGPARAKVQHAEGITPGGE